MCIKQPTFENLTKYLSQLDTDNIGTWIIDRENDGTPKNPIQMPFVNYSEMVRCFINDVYEFCDNHEDFDLYQYGKILEQNGLEWDSKAMSEADVSHKDAQCILALIMGAVRAERFCDGALLNFFKNGSIYRWLKRLQEIDGGTV